MTKENGLDQSPELTLSKTLFNNVQTFFKEHSGHQGNDQNKIEFVTLTCNYEEDGKTIKIGINCIDCGDVYGKEYFLKNKV